MHLCARRRLAAEAIGTTLLLATVVGSGIMGERLAAGSEALALLANALATGAGLYAFLLALGPVSGAHLNPAVTLAEAARGAFAWRQVPGYALAQVAGAFAGVALAHGMFGEPIFAASLHVRAGSGVVLSEAVATFGLLLTIGGCARSRPAALPLAVGAYIAAAYWFTASTAFANPAATLARAATATFAGIRPADVPGFLLGEAAGAVAAVAATRWLLREGEA